MDNPEVAQREGFGGCVVGLWGGEPGLGGDDDQRIKGMDTEKKFLDALGQVKKWKISRQQLLLSDAEGKVIGPPAAAGVPESHSSLPQNLQIVAGEVG